MTAGFFFLGATLWQEIRYIRCRRGHLSEKICIYVLRNNRGSPDTFQEKGECTLREIIRLHFVQGQDDVMAGVKKVKIFPALLHKTAYIASRRH